MTEHNKYGVQPANLTSTRAGVEWIDLANCLPNPLNPRRNDGIKTEEMQNIIKKRGFEEPLTVYKRGKNYIVLAGHRRLFAAKETKTIKQIPVFVVEAPKTHQEEIERIASLQSGRVQWTAWEWCRFVYERYIAWGRPAINSFAKEIVIPRKTVESYIMVMDYFPSVEIEAGVNTGLYSVRALFDAIMWIREVKKYHIELVEDLSEVMIRRSLLSKLEYKSISQQGLRKRGYLDKLTEPLLKEFFLNKKMTLEELMIKCDVDMTERSFQGRLISIGLARKNVKGVAPKNGLEAKKAFDHLKELHESVKNQLKDIERKYPELKKDDLFEW